MCQLHGGQIPPQTSEKKCNLNSNLYCGGRFSWGEVLVVGEEPVMTCAVERNRVLSVLTFCLRNGTPLRCAIYKLSLLSQPARKNHAAGENSTRNFLFSHYPFYHCIFFGHVLGKINSKYSTHTPHV